MSSTNFAALPPSEPNAKLYRAIWRWHFYAGLFVIPLLIMLSVTGLIMLWFTAVSPEFGERLTLTNAGTPLPVNALLDNVSLAYPDAKIGQFIAAYTPTNPVLFRLDTDAGAHMIAVDPYTGSIIKDTLKDSTWNAFATKIHGTLLLGGDGGVGDILIEISASLGILLIATGLYLWWPRGSTTWRQALIPQFTTKGRSFWKSLHSTLGIWLSIILLFFFISGLAWASVWGGKFVQAWSTFPAEKWEATPSSTLDHASMNHGSDKDVPWTLEQTMMPASGSPAGISGISKGTSVTLESIVALGRALGFEGRFQVAFPTDEKGVWTVSQDSQSYDSQNPFGDRTVHVDQYSGKILASVVFADYPILGKAMAVGIAVHEGQTGWWNIIANFLFCIAIIVLCMSGIIMWWLRRPSAQFGAPRYVKNTKIPAGVLVVGGLLAAAFPLGGLAIAAFAMIDFLLPKSWKQASAKH